MYNCFAFFVCLSIFNILIRQTTSVSLQPYLSSVHKNISQYEIHEKQTLNLTISQPITINLLKTKIKTPSTTPTLLSTLSKDEHSIIIERRNEEDDLNKQGNITISIKVIEGLAEYYFVQSKNNAIGEKFMIERTHLKNNRPNTQMVKQQQFIGEYFQLKQGINIINLGKLKSHFQKPSQSKSIIRYYSILCIPKTLTKVLIRFGNADRTMNSIKMQQNVSIVSEANEISNKIYKLIVVDSYAIRFIRKKGFPVITLFECPKDKVQCFHEVHQIPTHVNNITDNGTQSNKFINPSNHRKFVIESMLTKSEEYVGTKCSDCELYLSIQAKQYNQAEVEVIIQPPSSITQLKENEILKEDLIAGATKKYEIHLNSQQAVRISVQVYEGDTTISVREEKGDWFYTPTQTSGVILIDVPIALKAKTLLLEITAYAKDATYIVVYSQGQYEIFMRDGYPTTHILNPNQNISFFYHNEQVRNTPIYLSFNLNKPKSISNIIMKIYYYHQQTDNKLQRIEFKPTKSIQQLQKQANSIVIQISGNYPKVQIYFSSSWNETVEIAMTINDQQIIFLPLSHSLPLQIQKDSGINLLIDNNQQGFIDLTIKKCDESFPQIAYSLSPQDFMRKIYDYESLGESQRITKSTIKVKKGGGLYIRISGDQISNSFIQISAKYMQKDRKKFGENTVIKRGNHGQMNYQLITNSKAQIWFKEVQCSSQCKQTFKYQYYLSTHRSDLFREMICHGVFIFKKEEKEGIKTQWSEIKTKPDNEGIIAFQQTINHPIEFLSVKAKNQDEQLIYKDIEIVTFTGQISRMSTQFLLISIGIVILIAIVLFIAIRRQARMGYIAIGSEEKGHKKISKKQIIKGI